MAVPDKAGSANQPLVPECRQKDNVLPLALVVQLLRSVRERIREQGETNCPKNGDELSRHVHEPVVEYGSEDRKVGSSEGGEVCE